MFTGIIQDLGTIKIKKEGVYQIITNLNLSKCKEGSSISCNGVCLTAKNITQIDKGSFSFEVNIGEKPYKEQIFLILSQKIKKLIWKSLFRLEMKLADTLFTVMLTQ